VLLLALDTATPAVTVALHDGVSVVAEIDVALAPAIAELLRRTGRAATDLTDITVGVGPGPFTGLRVGIATAVVMASALRIPVHGVCSLDAIAWRTAFGGPFLVATDARRREVYWAGYSAPDLRVSGPAVDRPSDVAARAAGLPVVGPGADLVQSASGQPAAGTAAPLSAGALAELAVRRMIHGGELLEPRPLYLRRPDAKPPGDRKRVLA
jgi:tRNA threonylcarbamoyl adenosine modification protein YeaZ